MLSQRYDHQNDGNHQLYGRGISSGAGPKQSRNEFTEIAKLRPNGVPSDGQLWAKVSVILISKQFITPSLL